MLLPKPRLYAGKAIIIFLFFLPWEIIRRREKFDHRRERVAPRD
jgi:hypothetical protein